MAKNFLKRPIGWPHLVALALGLIVALVLQHAFPHTQTVMQGNTELTISMITFEALRVLKNNLTFTRRINRQFDGKYGVEGAKIGTTLNVRKPAQYTVRTGQTLQIQDFVETSVPVTLDKQKGVDLAFSSQELLLDIDDFSRRILNPAIAALANQIDYDGLQLYSKVAQIVGTPGVTPATSLIYLNAGVSLDNSLTPMDGRRSMVITPQMQATLVSALSTLFQSASAIAEQYVKGTMGTTAGFDFFMDQNCPTHTFGDLGGAPAVDGATANGASTVVTKSWTAAAATRLNTGDVFYLAGVYKANAQNRQSVGSLMPLVVTAPGVSDGAGAMTIAFDPPLVLTGAYQNVTALPADGALLTFASAASIVSPQGLAFHEDAFTLACADLPLPRNVDMAARANDEDLGLSIRMVRAYDVYEDIFPCRLDILYGWACLRPELAVRVAS